MNKSLIAQILTWVVETFDLQTNDTFRKVVGTGVTILALIYGIFQVALEILNTTG